MLVQMSERTCLRHFGITHGAIETLIHDRDKFQPSVVSNNGIVPQSPIPLKGANNGIVRRSQLPIRSPYYQHQQQHQHQHQQQHQQHQHQHQQQHQQFHPQSYQHLQHYQQHHNVNGMNGVKMEDTTKGSRVHTSTKNIIL